MAYFTRSYGESVSLVYAAICANTNTVTGHATINDVLLSTQTGLHRHTINSAIEILSAHHMVEVREKGKGKGAYEIIPLHEDHWKDILTFKDKPPEKDENIPAQHVQPLDMCANLEKPDNVGNSGQHVQPLDMSSNSTCPMEKKDVPVSDEENTTCGDKHSLYKLYNNLNSLNKNISKNLFFLSELPEEEDDEEETVEEKKRRIVARIEPYRKAMSPEVYAETLLTAFQQEGEGIE